QLHFHAAQSRFHAAEVALIGHREFPLPKFRVDDTVQITKYKNIFTKGYEANFTEEIFKVVKVFRGDPNMYEIESHDGEPIIGKFYEEELSAVDKKDDMYRVEKILRRRKGMRKQTATTIAKPKKSKRRRKEQVSLTTTDGMLGVMKRAYTLDKKDFLKRELGVNINKGDGPSSTIIFDKMKLTMSRSLSRRMNLDAPQELVDNVLENIIERMDDELSNQSEAIGNSTIITENELRELRGILNVKGNSGKQKIEYLGVERNHWKELARIERTAGREQKALLYEAMADMAELKADEIRLRSNERPKGPKALSIVEEETEISDLTWFERFKKWTKENIAGISAVAISVAVANLAGKVGPVLASVLNLIAKVLGWGAKGIAFLAKNLWILALALTYFLKDFMNEAFDAGLITLGTVAVSVISKKFAGDSLGVPSSPKGILKLAVALGAGNDNKLNHSGYEAKAKEKWYESQVEKKNRIAILSAGGINSGQRANNPRLLQTIKRNGRIPADHDRNTRSGVWVHNYETIMKKRYRLITNRGNETEGSKLSRFAISLPNFDGIKKHRLYTTTVVGSSDKNIHMAIFKNKVLSLYGKQPTVKSTARPEVEKIVNGAEGTKKVYLVLKCELVKEDKKTGQETYTVFHGRSNTHAITVNISEEIMYEPLKGKGYTTPLPKPLKEKRVITNIKNEDNQCFKWAVTRALNPVKPRKSNGNNLSRLIAAQLSKAEHTALCEDHKLQHHYYPSKEPMDHVEGDPKTSFTIQYQKHRPSGFSYTIKCMDENVYKTKFITYTAQNKDEDIKKIFVDSLEENLKLVYEILKKVTPISMIEEDKKNYTGSNNCYACNIQFGTVRINEGDGEEEKVIKCRDHCHITGKYRGAACDKCNLRMRTPKFVPILFHNLESYDAHLFVKSLGFSEGDINCIPKTDEKYISFSKKIPMETIISPDGEKTLYLEMRFIDSYKFTLASLDSLANTLGEDDFRTLESQMKHSRIELLKRKGVFSYEFMTGYDKLQYDKLPSKKEFYSKLNNTDISDEDYEHAQKVWKTFDCKTMRDYHDLYLKTDVLLLTDVMCRFRKICIENYGLDPLHHYTAPGLAWMRR
ncbi:uncharacterized transposon-derived, partial [Paramuricea clavata]